MRTRWRIVYYPALLAWVERVQVWLVWHLPAWIVYYALIRAWANATQGPWSGEQAPSVLMAHVIQRWDSTHPK